MMIGIQIAVEVAVDGATASTGGGIPANARIADDSIERITDDNQIRIID